MDPSLVNKFEDVFVNRLSTSLFQMYSIACESLSPVRKRCEHHESGWVEEIVFVEPIIAQIVHQDLVGREVEDLTRQTCHQLVRCHNQVGLAPAVLDSPVLPMPNRGHGHYDLQLRVESEQGGERGEQGGACFLRTHDPPGKERVRQLVAVGHNLSRLPEDERPGRPEGHEEEARGEQELPRSLKLGVHHPQRVFLTSRGEPRVMLKAEPPPLMT
eukprot:50114-Hanusia_phi.AAC.2